MLAFVLSLCLSWSAPPSAECIEPRAAIVAAVPVAGDAVAFLHADGSRSLATLADLMAGRSGVTWSTGDNEAAGPPIRHTLEYESAVGTIKVDIDCRSYGTSQGCIDAFADAVRRMQTAFPKLPS